VLAHLPDRKPSRVIGLSVGYRIPGQIMELANKVMAVGDAVAACAAVRACGRCTQR
jgi:D-arabinose 1-dehydrogenase-like Zn-dependent alcohol dehydrogenase